MAILLLINSIIGAWLSIMYAHIFNLYRLGYGTYEPDKSTATVEMIIAIIMACWFVGQFAWIVRKIIMDLKETR